MKKTTICMAVLAIAICTCTISCSKSVSSDKASTSHETGDDRVITTEAAFGIAGFATQNGNTTGGQGGSTVTATTYAQLKSYLESSTTYIVRVDGRIYNGVKGGRININSNKTLLGVGTAGFLDGVGLNISSKRNIIIQNIKVTLTSITDRSDPAVYDPDGDEGLPQIIVNGGDCISIQGSSSNVWIDHCELYNTDPTVQTNKDLYDGLIDIKNTSQYITISWNYFHDNHKTHLIGSSDSDISDRKLTFHHNYYRNIGSRLPLNRGGVAHVYNNYYNVIRGSGIDSRMGACVRVENNVFETAKSPIIASGSTLGKYQVLGNTFSGITGTAAPTSSTCTFTPPYSYSLDAASAVKSGVMSGAGIGKI
ncbi:pectate lyase [Niastella caeni]|uniref:Pectate lyase n=1 Tax=Niastella caeni TaxID=2569763 RepID=A0A4S8HSD7_9BACT|nr:pectate lyase [Niastella caeni]THU36884.1 pectate lyase [Niastella caeni]